MLPERIFQKWHNPIIRPNKRKLSGLLFNRHRVIRLYHRDIIKIGSRIRFLGIIRREEGIYFRLHYASKIYLRPIYRSRRSHTPCFTQSTWVKMRPLYASRPGHFMSKVTFSQTIFSSRLVSRRAGTL